ncbi:MAG: NAD(P)/FAD-dependent oxidoreductase [Candidatus Aenigmatarchaeota archaeon]
MENEKEFDVVIVGAGSSGLRLSYLLPEDLKILVLEKNEKVEIKSTGLVSYRFFKIAKELPKEKLILNKFHQATFNFPHGSFKLKSKRYMYLLNIKKFEDVLFKHAKEKAQIKFGTSFLNRIGEDVITSKGKIKAKILIGADGPLSRVALVNGISLSKEIFSSAEGIIKEKLSNGIEIYFNNNYSKNYFIWLVAVDEERAKIGIINENNALNLLNNFIHQRFGKVKFENFYGDTIRIGLPSKTYFDGGFLLGDAAGQLKPYSAGGFTYAAIATEIAADAIKKAFKQNDFSKEFFKENYENKWKKELLPAIKKGYLVRKTFKILKNNKFVFSLVSCLKSFLQTIDLDLL